MTFASSIAGANASTRKRPAARAPERSGTGSIPSPWPVSLLGVPFDNVTGAEAVTRIDTMIATRRPHYVVTANVDFLVQAQRDVELRRILLAADLVLCDGMPLRWASRWLGNPLRERVAGSDLVPLLMRSAAEKGQRIFLLGGGPGVASDAARQLELQHPTLAIAGHFSPPFCDLLAMDFAAIGHRVRAARPDILLVSFGCPKQEKWIAMHYRQLGVPVLIGVGATLDFIAGRMKRAPPFMQRSGTECLYRLAQEPRRLARRYLRDLVGFVPAIARQYWHLRRPRRPRGTATLFLTCAPDGRKFRLAGVFNAAVLHREPALLSTAQRTGDDCELDLAQVCGLDSTGAAILVQWHKRLLDQGKRLTLLHPSVAVRHTLQVLGLLGYFWIAEKSVSPPRVTDLDDPNQPVIPPYPGGHTIGWQGDITAGNAEAVWALTINHLAADASPPRQTFVIDLSRLRFIDSAGAGLMRRLHVWAGERQRGVHFLGTSPAVRNVLHLARLDRLLEAPRR